MDIHSNMAKTKSDIERGERIRALTKKAGYSGSELSAFLHYKGHSSVSKLFSGDIKPTGEVLKKLSQFFGVSTDYILYGTHMPAISEPIKTQEQPIEKKKGRSTPDMKSQVYNKRNSLPIGVSVDLSIIEDKAKKVIGVTE